MVSTSEVFERISNGDVSFVEAWGGINAHGNNGRTLLTCAIRLGNHLNIVKSLLKLGANIDLQETGGATPLLLAVYLNRLDVISQLVSGGADMEAKDPYDNSPLIVAIQENFVEIVTFLINNGADVKSCDIRGTPGLIKAINENKLEIVKKFMEREMGEDDVVDAENNTPLIAAIRNKSSSEIIECLLEHGVDVDETKNAKTPLAWAAIKGDTAAMELLLEFDADINLLSSTEDTALGNAVVMNTHLKAVKFLIEKGANTCKAGSNGKSPLFWAVINENDSVINSLLDHGAEFMIDEVFLDAIETQNLKIVKLLKERGASIKRDQQNNIITSLPRPLQKAVDIQNEKITKYLIENGTDVVEDLAGNEVSIIIQFLDKKNMDMVKLLTENGARLNECADSGETVLTKAVEMENLIMVKYFLSQGADVNQHNRNGLTPLLIAESRMHFPIFQFLVDSGAQINAVDEGNFPNLGRHFRLAQKFNLDKESSQKPNQDKTHDDGENIMECSQETDLEKTDADGESSTALDTEDDSSSSRLEDASL